MRHLLLMLVLLLTSCCPTLSGPPGDQGTIAWRFKPRPFVPEVIDCKGGTRGSLEIRKSGVTVRNCTIEGSIRIWGVARNSKGDELREMSRKATYVSDLRAVSPTDVVIEDVVIRASRTIPLYVGPGVTFTRVSRVTLYGQSDSTMVYLDAESHGTVIEDSRIDASNAAREAVAIDASDYNEIRRTLIVHSNGGVYGYRNCGEDAVIRHTTPSDNLVEDVELRGPGVAIWWGSRNGDRCYCELDKGWPFGSSASDMDHSRRNVVRRVNLGGGVVRP